MSNLAPAGRTKATDFTHRVLREVVVEQETTLDFALLEVVHELLVFFGAERRGNERLGFTTRKQGRTMNAWQPTHFTGDRLEFLRTFDHPDDDA